MYDALIEIHALSYFLSFSRCFEIHALLLSFFLPKGDAYESSPKKQKRAAAVTGKRPNFDEPPLDAADGELRQKRQFRENKMGRSHTVYFFPHSFRDVFSIEKIRKHLPSTFSANILRELFLPEVFGQESDFIYTKNSARPGSGFYLHKEQLGAILKKVKKFS